MTKSELRKQCNPPNRERFEHNLAEVYRKQGWEPFEYIIYAESPLNFGRPSSYYWRDAPTNEKVRLSKLNDHFSGDNAKLGAGLRVRGDLLYFYNHSGLCNKDIPKAKDLLLDVLDVLPYARIPIALVKPLECHFNDENRPHRTDGPAVLWRNGDRQYWFNGVRVSRRFIEVPPTVSYINRQWNAERKRILIERFGQEEYLKAMKAKVIAEDEFGKLWATPQPTTYINNRWTRIPDPRRERMVFVEVINASPEPDGTYSHFFLRVPPDTKTPKQAVAWTFNQPPKKFQLAAQS